MHKLIHKTCESVAAPAAGERADKHRLRLDYSTS